MNVQKINGLILAAGMSRRMGEFKPLMQMENKTLIENSIDSMLRAGVNKIVVVLGYQANLVEYLLSKNYRNQQIRIVYNDQYATSDMLYSTKLGVREIGDCDAFFLLPGDMPAVGRHTFMAETLTMNITGAKVVFPTLEGRKKHPPLIRAYCVNDILIHNSDTGLRTLWDKYDGDIATVAVDDFGCAIDNDTYEDYLCCVKYMKETRMLRLSVGA